MAAVPDGAPVITKTGPGALAEEEEEKLFRAVPDQPVKPRGAGGAFTVFTPELGSPLGNVTFMGSMLCMSSTLSAHRSAILS